MKKIICLILCFVFYCTICFSDGLKKAPGFSLRKVSFGDTSSVSLDEYKQNIVLLVFFARWNIPSVNQIPVIEGVADSYQEVIALGINSSLDADNNLTRFENQMSANFPFLASDGVVTQKYGVGQNLPVVVLITADSQEIYKKYTGPVSYQKLKQDIDKLLAEEKAKREEEKLKEKLKETQEDSKETSNETKTEHEIIYNTVQDTEETQSP
ncbi:MAG: TlpA disulfide reductase family protein [Candidatus Omnitrophica bacterium]|nr:TlpA disulfide reductase family protein [Candidatus Omnitrophota bacterium]